LEKEECAGIKNEEKGMGKHSYVALGPDTEQGRQCKWAHCNDNPLSIMPILKTFFKEFFLHIL